MYNKGKFTPKNKLTKDKLKIGQLLKSPSTGELYEVTALGKRYLLVEIRTENSRHEFPRRYSEVENYELVSCPATEQGSSSKKRSIKDSLKALDTRWRKLSEDC